MARARRPLGNRAGHPARRTRPAHAAEAAAVGAGRADRWRARAAAVAARPARPAALHGQPARQGWHAAAALQRRWDLRQRGKRGGMSPGTVRN